ncbi:hypothetical protein SETIT_5G182700v2 [Setaria italica]|uniref:non-specific serine/threonine protein kinase n=1 Tax=Setaria italica TaxID=4555 RepID=A0A368R6E7_SETIT|nr:hypothetical protein SETIT_5G182700v2 [Setaria italica]
MGLDVTGNLVLFDQNNSSVWQSFDHPTDTLVLGQSLCRGKNLSAKPSNTKWPAARIYFSAELDGLQYSFKPAAYTQVFQATTPSTYRTTTCYAFVNGSLGFPDKIFSLPLAKSVQLMRLESDGHLRLYEMGIPHLELLMVLDVLSIAMKFCDYPLACGDYGVCNNGQCSCPSLSHFRFQDERHPDAGCTPLTSISCNHVHTHQLIPLYNVSYFSYDRFLSLATQGTPQRVCMHSCLVDCSCKAVLFQKSSYRDDYGNCLLLSEENLILLTEDLTGPVLAFFKIQDDHSEKRTIITKCKKDVEPLFDGIPGTPKCFSFYELKVATRNFSMKLGVGGFGSVFKGTIGKETIAVKRLEGVDQGMEEFLAEVKTIGRIHQLNLVRLVGFCAEKSHRLLVYEYLCNGSLDKWIFHTSPVFTLSWKTRQKADIYSFGIVMVEIICGRENLDESQPEESIHLISLLQEKARFGQLSDLVDSASNDMKFHMDEVIEAMKLAMWCLQVDSSRRPLMSTVAKVLEGVMSMEAAPDCTFVPSFVSSNAHIVGLTSSYVPSESHLSGPW